MKSSINLTEQNYDLRSLRMSRGEISAAKRGEKRKGGGSGSVIHGTWRK